MKEVGCFAVDNPEITEVLDLKTGDFYPVEKVIGSDYGEAMALRMALREAIAMDNPLYVCPMCGVPVYLVSRKKSRKFFFRHLLEDGRCPLITRGILSEEEINARKYNGAKESLDHIRMKEIVAESLRCDPRFSDVQVEAVWKGQDRTTWRKPDVRALYNNTIPVAFEIQLSTTFLRVIAERRMFYLKEGGLLCWIFKSYNEEQARLAQDDVFFSNNRNLFLASEETLDASLSSGAFMLDCRWLEPYLSDDRIETRWNRRVAPFQEMTIDKAHQRVFIFDYERAVEALNQNAEEQALRQEFEQYWLAHVTYGSDDDWQAWLQLRHKFKKRGIMLPLYPNQNPGPVYLLNALYSAREGRPVGWKFKKLVEVAHRIDGGHKPILRAFRHALAVYDRAEQIKKEDRHGRWMKKVTEYRKLLADNHADYEPDRSFDKLIHYLFPEIGRY